ncbi:MAG: Rha family transcriptional regulator [Saprospiraceae bacterium]|nr:Rha family transcriptional regulator [Saprospiraceae bacterium]
MLPDEKVFAERRLPQLYTPLEAANEICELQESGARARRFAWESLELGQIELADLVSLYYDCTLDRMRDLIKQLVPKDPEVSNDCQHEQREVRVDTRLIAEKLGVEHRSILQTIDKYQSKMESFGPLAFQMQVRENAGIPTRYALLNEDQCYFLATLSRNTDRVVAFKMWLVEMFSEYRNAERKAAQTHDADADYFTVAGWYSLHGESIPLDKAQRIGKKCTQASRKSGYLIGSAHNPRFGACNTYHRSVLQSVVPFKALLS